MSTERRHADKTANLAGKHRFSCKEGVKKSYFFTPSFYIYGGVLPTIYVNNSFARYKLKL